MSLAFAEFDLQPYLPFIVGFGVALVLSALWYILSRRRNQQFGPPIVAAPKDREQPSDDTYANRRSSSRREGSPVRVILSSPAFRGQMEHGWVLDRSTGGLRIAISQPMPVGSVLQVRAENAPNTIPWVTVTVRSCRNERDRHEIGCAFDTTPPWNVLLLFG